MPTLHRLCRVGPTVSVEFAKVKFPFPAFLQLDEPLLSCHLPLGHGLHHADEFARGASLKVPIGQGTTVVLKGALQEPVETQTPEPGPLNVLIVQFRHALAVVEPLALLNVSILHRLHIDTSDACSRLDHVPIGHGKHVEIDVAPVELLYVPGGHGLQ